MRRDAGKILAVGLCACAGLSAYTADANPLADDLARAAVLADDLARAAANAARHDASSELASKPNNYLGKILDEVMVSEIEKRRAALPILKTPGAAADDDPTSAAAAGGAGALGTAWGLGVFDKKTSD